MLSHNSDMNSDDGDSTCELSLSERTAGNLLRQAVAQHGERVFLRTGDRSVTYGAFNIRVNAIANGLARLGTKKGARIALMMRNSEAFLECIFASAKLGAIYVPLNTDYKGDVLTHQLNRSAATIAVIDDEFCNVMADVESNTSTLNHIVIHHRLGVFPKSFRRWATIDYTVLANSDANDPAEHVSYMDPFAINFTSGTTGPSKGVLATHGHVITFSLDWIRACGFRSDDKLYTPLPMFHAIATWLGVIPAMIMGTEVAFVEKFSASRFWDDVRRYGATVVHGIFSIIPILLKQPPRSDDADVPARLFYVGQRNPEFEKRFNCRIVEVYGATETGIVTYTPQGELARPGSCGRVNSLTYEVEIVDENDNILPPGASGEIVVRPKQPFSMIDCYYRDAEATVKAFRNLWFHTGDSAKRDEDGFFYFVDRKKDAIRRRGENIASFEVESIINQHEAILECAVVAMPSPLGEDDVHAIVVKRPGAALTAEQLWAFCDAAMPRFWVPRYIEFRNALPKTANQKIQKYLLRESKERGELHDRERLK